MVLHILRGIFVLLMAGVGWAYIKDANALVGPYSWLALAIVVSAAVLLVCIDILASRRKLSIFAGIFFGLVVGLSIAYGLSFVTTLIVDQYQALSGPTALLEKERDAVTAHINLIMGVITCYLSISFILQTKDDFRFIIPYVEFSKQTKGARQILLDTSVLIDGRIADVVNSGIVESQLVVPRFVIQELHTLSDSAEKLKRNRGKRGLDTVAELKANPRVDLVDYDASGRHDLEQAVDELLLLVAKDINARVLTNDSNLNKVAHLRGVDVINLNELANALKPVVLPGEKMIVRIVKPGEESGQGVGYLDDGTMVVVEQARQHINSEVEFVVTNTRQTTAGKMIFGRAVDHGGATEGEESAEAPATPTPRRSRPQRSAESTT